MTAFAQTPVDIEISPASGDITAELNAAIGDGKVAKNITINLAANGNYTLSNPIPAAANVIINGSGAVIDVTNCMPAPGSGSGDDEEEESGSSAAPFILMNSKPQVTATNNFYRVDKIQIKDVTLKGLKNSLFYDNKVAYCIVDFTIDNVVMQLETTTTDSKALIGFKKGGYKDLTVKNSTIYGNNSKKLEFFIVGKADLTKMGYSATTDKHNITYKSNTFVNVLPTTADETWSDDAFVGAAYVIYDIQDNIWYNCGLNIAIGLTGKDADPTVKKTFSKNTYYTYDDKALAIKDQAVLESTTDNSNDILTTDPTFVDIANGDFHLHPGSLQAKYGTGDPRWKVTYDATKALPADIVMNLKVAENITDRLNAAKNSLDKVGDITIILAEGAKYMLTQPIRSSGSVTITGLNSQINCTRVNGPMIILEGTDSLAYNITAKDVKGEKNPNYKHVETVNLTGIKTTLKKYGTIVQETQKTLVDNVIVDDCVFELAGANNLFDFAGFPLNLEITNTTFWSETGHTGHILHAGGRTRDLDKSQAQDVLLQTITIDYCTLYQISVGVGFNDLAAKASRTLALTLTNSIIYNCTVNGGEVKGWMGGAEADGPTMVYDHNTYWNKGAIQGGWIDMDESLDGRDRTETAFKADPGFCDVEAGDFGIANKAPQAQVPEGQTQYGDPRWSTWAAGDNYVATSFVATHGSVSTDKVYASEGSEVIATITPTEGYVLDTFTVTDANGNDVPVSDGDVAAARAAATDTGTLTRSFVMPSTDVTINVTFRENTTGIQKVTNNTLDINGVWYDMRGRKYTDKPTQAGVYIQNGKKVVLK